MYVFAEARKAVVGAVLSAAALGATHAQESEVQARTGAFADGASAVVGVATGAISVNPLLPLVGLGFKAATLQYTKGLPETERAGAYALAAASWQGSAALNICATASALSGGSFLPACVALGMVWGWKTWSESGRERRLAERCAVLREFVGKPKMPCTYFPRGVELADGPTETAAGQVLIAHSSATRGTRARTKPVASPATCDPLVQMPRSTMSSTRAVNASTRRRGTPCNGPSSTSIASP